MNGLRVSKEFPFRKVVADKNYKQDNIEGFENLVGNDFTNNNPTLVKLMRKS